MSSTEIALSSLTQHERREIEIDPEGLAAGFEARNYRLGLAASPGATDLVSVNFGPPEWNASRGTWLVTLTPADVAKLPPGDVYLGVWEVGVPQPLEPIYRLTAGRVPGRPIT